MSKEKKPPIRFPRQAPLELVTFQDSSHCWVGIKQGTNDLVAEGSSHREREDEFDQNVGMMLATGRALEALSKKLMKHANGLVKHHDDMREYKEQREGEKVWEIFKGAFDRGETQVTVTPTVTETEALSIWDTLWRVGWEVKGSNWPWSWQEKDRDLDREGNLLITKVKTVDFK